MATNFTILQTAQCSSSVLCNTACLTLCLHTQGVCHLSTHSGTCPLSSLCGCYYCLNAAAITTEKHSHPRICVCSYFRKPHLSHKDFATICIVSTNVPTAEYSSYSSHQLLLIRAMSLFPSPLLNLTCSNKLSWKCFTTLLLIRTYSLFPTCNSSATTASHQMLQIRTHS